MDTGVKYFQEVVEPDLALEFELIIHRDMALAMLTMEVANLLEPSPILQGTGIAMKNYLLDKDPIFFDRAAKFITRHMVGYINSCQENSHEPSSASH